MSLGRPDGGRRPGHAAAPEPRAPEHRAPSVDDDDLDRAFGPDTASLAVRTPRQRVRRSALVGAFVVVAVGVLAVVLVTIVGSVQDGVGGVFPRPQAALDRFDAAARAVDGVQRVQAADPQGTAFAGYEVQSTVTMTPGATEAQRTAAVHALRDAAEHASGNGVRVFAVADFGAVQVGVSADPTVTDRRLDLVHRIDAIGGVQSIHCAWADVPSDEPAEQRVAIGSPASGAALGAVVAKATHEAHAVFPGSSVTATTTTH